MRKNCLNTFKKEKSLRKTKGKGSLNCLNNKMKKLSEKNRESFQLAAFATTISVLFN